MMTCSAPIVVFDSGFGGISVLKKLTARCPAENYLYFGDSRNAPYGPRPAEEVRRLTLDAIGRFVPESPKAVVIACNTATAAALEDVRQMLPDIPVIGIRPALRQAEATGCRRILSLATAGTLASPSYARQCLALQPETEVVSIAAPGIVRFVEGGMTRREETVRDLKELFRPIEGEAFEAVVLGCTHFPFAKNEIRTALGREVRFFDAADDVAKKLAGVLNAADRKEKNNVRGSVTFLNSTDSDEAIRLSWALFSSPC